MEHRSSVAREHDLPEAGFSLRSALTLVPWLRKVAAGLLLFVLVGALLTARIVREGESELRESDAAFDRGDLRESILHARRAAISYAPGAPHVRAAYARLSAVALGAEAKGDPDVARLAWGAVRGAVLETRHLWTPREADLARANANLARLAAIPGGPDRARQGELLARDSSPRALWVFALGTGFALFGAGIGLLALRGVTAAGRISKKEVAIAVALAVLGVACWTLAVYRA